MRRNLILISVLLVIIILMIAAFTKPDDKKIKIDVIAALWGDKVPDKVTPQYYEQFMNLTTRDIDIDDWLFVKRIKYTVNHNTAIIGYGAFGKVMLRK